MLSIAFLFIGIVITGSTAVDPDVAIVALDVHANIIGLGRVYIFTVHRVYPVDELAALETSFPTRFEDLASNPCRASHSVCDVHANCTLITPFAAQCSCPEGFIQNASVRAFDPSTLVPDGTSCPEIDECSTGSHNCHALASCLNIPGTFQCSCAVGFTGNAVTECADVNECDLDTHNCDDNATCSNTNGSFVCSCNFGFTGNGETCAALSECPSSFCDVNAKCFVQPNSSSTFCQCKPGYIGDGNTCTDVNECDAFEPCDPVADCINTNGSFECSCPSSYTGNGFTCVDVNECLLLLGVCHANATCINVLGSFQCLCLPGYTGDGRSCEKITCDYLTLQDICDLNATCVDSSEGITCECSEGFTGNGTVCTRRQQCEFIWEPCTENEQCHNLNSSFECLCKKGFVREKSVCVPAVADCHYCHESSECHPIEDVFVCRCPRGFIGDGDVCTDIRKIFKGPGFIFRAFWLALTQNVRRRSYRLANPDFKLPIFLRWTL